jgi:hypothetical protein
MLQIFQPPQHGGGIWPPLAYAIDALAIISLVTVLLLVAWVIMQFH